MAVLLPGQLLWERRLLLLLLCCCCCAGRLLLLALLALLLLGSLAVDRLPMAAVIYCPSCCHRRLCSSAPRTGSRSLRWRHRCCCCCCC